MKRILAILLVLAMLPIPATFALDAEPSAEPIAQEAYDAVTADIWQTIEAIEVTVVAPTKEDLYLYEWYLCNEKASGCLKFDIDDVRQSEGETVCRNLHFDGAQCFSIHENYDIQSSSRRLLTLLITADSLTANDVRIGEEPEDTFSF